ncbi:hypothetical protein [Leptospira kmetyi]|uniref:hypothetical protein n=1 Tax=Leptospira kmetyi TaxID=408139 RepID=UPI003EC113D7
MISIMNASDLSIGTSLVSDNLIEFHCTRLLLLISICGKYDKQRKAQKIDGLTKLAKLDFFVRYPSLFNKATEFLKLNDRINDESIESKMIRFHYGPWDKRYYQILPFLTSRGLIEISKKGSHYEFILNESANELIEILMGDPNFADLINKIKKVGLVFSSYNGNKLKTLVYDLFESEVKNKNLGDLIQ